MTQATHTIVRNECGIEIWGAAPKEKPPVQDQTGQHVKTGGFAYEFWPEH